MILILPASALAYTLAASLQPATAAEVAVYTNKPQTNMSSLDVDMSKATDLASAAEAYGNHCPINRMDEVEPDCLVKEIGPLEHEGYSADIIIQKLDVDVPAGSIKFMKEALGLGNMEIAYVQALIKSGKQETLRKYLDVASLIATFEDPNSDRLPPLQKQADALKEGLMAVKATFSFGSISRPVSNPIKENGLRNLRRNVLELNNADIRTRIASYE